MTKSYHVVYEEKIFYFLSDPFTSVYQVLGIIFKSNIIQLKLSYPKIITRQAIVLANYIICLVLKLLVEFKMFYKNYYE
jgi:hypothetical protein